MNVGFVNIYPYRPHGHHAQFLNELCRQSGINTYALVCDANAKHCYLRELKGSSRVECIKCMAGSLRTFPYQKVDSAWKFWNNSNHESNFDKFVESSAYTLSRVESWEQRQSELVNEIKQKLLPSAINFYYATLRWIEHRKLNALIVFNGRMDMTRAAIEACNTAGIPFITHERPLFGHGIILNRNANCSSLAKTHRINQEYATKALTEQQCRIAAKLVAERLTGGNKFEWKLYNRDPSNITSWPTQTSGHNVLVCPSSKNELLGHPDWETEWKDNTDALDLAVSKGWFKYSEILIRFHPSWSIKFGTTSAHLCEEHYKQWCEKRNVAYVQSSSNISTRDLIHLSDVVILNGSNTVFEAGIIGKPVLCLGPSSYTYSGISVDILSAKDFDSIDFPEILSRDPQSIIRQTLRYCYIRAAREPVYTDFIRSTALTQCEFYQGADQQKLLSLIEGDAHLVDDTDYTESTEFEDAVMQVFKEQDFNALSKLASHTWHTPNTSVMPVTRIPPFGLIDHIRSLFPKGV